MPIQYNDKIKRPEELTNFTAEMVCELKHCSQDLIYFAQNYYYIVHPTTGKQKIKLRGLQRKLLNHFKDNRFSINMSSRQSGKCVFGNTVITVRNKKTGKIEEITIEDFFNSIKKK